MFKNNFLCFTYFFFFFFFFSSNAISSELLVEEVSFIENLHFSCCVHVKKFKYEIIYLFIHSFAKSYYERVF